MNLRHLNIRRHLRAWRLRRRLTRFTQGKLPSARVPVKCTYCPAWSWGDTSGEAVSMLFRHWASRHPDLYRDPESEEELADVRQA